MCKSKNDFIAKAKTYKDYVEKGNEEKLFNEIGKDSVQDLSRIIANQRADANGKDSGHSGRLISFIDAELFDRKVTHSRWSTWVVAAATVVIALSTIVNLLLIFSDNCLLTTRAISLGVSFLSFVKVLKISLDLFFNKGIIGNKNIFKKNDFIEKYFIPKKFI